VAPWGNHLLVLLDLTMRPLGEKGLEKYLSKRRGKRVREKVGKNAGRALALASLAPPPLPFTAFVMGAAALHTRARVCYRSSPQRGWYASSS